MAEGRHERSDDEHPELVKAMTDTEFSLWLMTGSATPEERIAECFTIIAESADVKKHKLERVGKAACHIAYRKLDGLELSFDQVEQAILKARQRTSVEHGEHPIMRTRWHGSLSIALAYLYASVGWKTEAAKNCETMISSEAVETYPQNTLNVLRAAMLACVYHATQSGRTDRALDHIEQGVRLFQLGVKTLQFKSVDTGFGEELAQWSTMIKLALEMRAAIKGMKRITWAKLAAIDKREPFHSTFMKMCDHGAWGKAEDARYSWLYQRNYGEAKPMQAIELAGLAPTDKVLDLGCGWATASPFFEDYTGVDVSSHVIALNKRDKRGVFHHASLHNLQCVKDQQFKAVICLDVMEHIPQAHVEATFHEIASLNADRFIFNICCRDSSNRGPSGETLHPTNKPPAWWRSELEKSFIGIEILKMEPARLIVAAKSGLHI